MYPENSIVYNPHRLRRKDCADVPAQTMGIVVAQRANGAWVLFEDRDQAIFCTGVNLKHTGFEVVTHGQRFARRANPKGSPDAA